MTNTQANYSSPQLRDLHIIGGWVWDPSTNTFMRRLCVTAGRVALMMHMIRERHLDAIHEAKHG